MLTGAVVVVLGYASGLGVIPAVAPAPGQQGTAAPTAPPQPGPSQQGAPPAGPAGPGRHPPAGAAPPVISPVVPVVPVAPPPGLPGGPAGPTPSSTVPGTPPGVLCLPGLVGSLPLLGPVLGPLLAGGPGASGDTPVGGLLLAVLSSLLGTTCDAAGPAPAEVAR
ncbi:MAG TPA: hypothetical protein VLJ59_18590 [Mycobacteriales bacterium]|nr:hypothetical protein [Mycobacteriales bacterium]